jgi:hypothetical protein
MISRENYLTLVKKALELSETKFARDAILNWLAAYPGDLEASGLYAKSLIRDGKPARAIPILRSISDTDPEYIEAVESLNECVFLFTPGDKTIPYTPINTLLYALKGPGSNDSRIEEWGLSLWEARKALITGQIADGLAITEELLAENQANPLIPITYIRLMDLDPRPALETNLNLLEDYHKRWPNCLFFTLKLADGLMFWGEHARALSLLHHAVSRDITAQVPVRIWGRTHRYQNLWPDNLRLAFDCPIPSTVMTVLGWNSLPAGEPVQEEIRISENPGEPNQDINSSVEDSTGVPEPDPDLKAEELASTKDRAAIISAISPNNRTPVYVVLSIKLALEEKFGAQSSEIILQKALDLVNVMNKMTGWKSLLFLADNPTASNLPQIKPARVKDPWSIKLSLVDLENLLASMDQRIGAVLIVGGPDIVPFHKLPNPVNDPDEIVLSDNPYSTLDENYFIPEWLVGRLPDGVKQNTNSEFASPSILITLIQQITERAQEQMHCSLKSKGWYKPFWGRLINRQQRSLTSFGYSAAVWGKVSETVFTPIGKAKNLFISPPHGRSYSPIEKQPKKWFSILGSKGNTTFHFKNPPKMKACLAYFNLHGLEDAPDWFGQRDPNNTDNAPDYPVALSIHDIAFQTKSGKTSLPQIIFSEACYGAHIQNKSLDEAISLKLLSSGSKVVIGSTGMSYGSIGMPLIAADLLAHSFWVFLKEGLTVGEALQRAKINMTQTMHARHGHLDGEDQKTLISFVLYGDPLSVPTDVDQCPKVPKRPSADLKNLKTISDELGSEEIPPELVAHVKKVVSRYLPGMSDAKFIYRIEEIKPGNGPKFTKSSSRLSATAETRIQRITLSKQFTRSNHVHNQVAHLTFTPKGKLIKLVISR